MVEKIKKKGLWPFGWNERLTEERAAGAAVRLDILKACKNEECASERAIVWEVPSAPGR